MGDIVALGAGAISFVAFAVLRGVFSLLTMAAAMYIWKRIARCRGTQVVRPATLLYFPVVAVVLLLAFAAVDGIRLLLSISASMVVGAVVVAMVVVPGGLLAGFMTGAMTHMYQTRWGRVMMKSSGNYLVFWFAMTIVAVFFLILPYGWLAIPTAGLMVFATLQLLVAHVVLYARYKQLQHKAVAAVPGPAINLSFDARGAAVVSCGMELWAKNGGAAVSAAAFAAAFAQGGRLTGDYALATLPTVQLAWKELAGSPELLQATLQTLITQGVLQANGAPGEQLARLLRMGVLARTITLGHTRFSADGKASERQQHAVLAQTGGTNLLFTGDRNVFAIREVQAMEMLNLLAQLWTPAGV
ncbi:MAG TPA: hypothetical protein PKM88_01750 [bacterium]|nr:hypothetical protein [bacterium]